MRTGRFPKHALDDFDLALVVCGGRVNRNRLPRHRIILTDLLGCRATFAIATTTTASGLLRGRVEQLGIFANAADENILGGQASHKPSRRKARIGKQDQLTCTKIGTHGLHLLQSLRRQIQFIGEFLVFFFLLGGSILFQFGGSGGVEIVDGNAAHGGGVREGKHGGELEHALRTNEIGLKGRTLGVAAPGHAGRLDSGGQQGVIDRDTKGRGFGKALRGGGTQAGEQLRDIEARGRE